MTTLLIIESNISDYQTYFDNRLVANKSAENGALDNLQVHYHQVDANHNNIVDNPALFALVEKANIILGQPAAIVKLLPHAKDLQWVQSSFAGVEPFMHNASAQDFILTGVKDIFGPYMSEYVFGYIAASERQFVANAQLQSEKKWQPLPYRGFNTIRIGICGLGSIGKHIAATAKHFNMHVSAMKSATSLNESIANVDELFSTEQLHAFVAEQDYIINILPNTPATYHLFNQAVFDAMDKKTTFINIGRGATVDTQALIHSLSNKSIKAAVLDVFEQEPLDKNSALWGMDNVVITPHNSAVSFAQDIIAIFTKNYALFCKNEALHYQVDRQKGY